MRTVIIHGQSHKGSTYHIARKLADKIGGEVTEFFLPRDFGEFCVGCGKCFSKGETFCPHFSKLTPITEAIDAADVIILASPVYVFHATGPMKALLDHYAYRWMVHRPSAAMFSKQAVCISTAAGGGTRSTNRDMHDSLFYWGAAKIYNCGINVAAVDWAAVPESIVNKIEKATDKIALKIKAREGKIKPGLKTKLYFSFMRIFQLKLRLSETDVEYWSAKGWLQNRRPWKN